MKRPAATDKKKTAAHRTQKMSDMTSEVSGSGVPFFGTVKMESRPERRQDVADFGDTAFGKIKENLIDSIQESCIKQTDRQKKRINVENGCDETNRKSGSYMKITRQTDRCPESRLNGKNRSGTSV